MRARRAVQPRAGMAMRRMGGFMALVMLAGCAGPVTVRQVSLVQSYRATSRSALQGNAPGNDTMIVLRRRGLLALWRNHPDRAIAALRTQAAAAMADDSADMLFALAELSYRQGPVSYTHLTLPTKA